MNVHTNIVEGTTAERAYKLWLAKQKAIMVIEYESEVLADKYHEEMKKACIPAHREEG